MEYASQSSVLRNTDREHLKGMKHQGVDSVCIITRMVQDKRQNWFRA